MIVGLEIRSAMKPSFASPAMVIMAPTSSARVEASAIARSGSWLASTNGMSVAAMIGPSDESGPRTRIFDGPKTAYATRHRIDV